MLAFTALQALLRDCTAPHGPALYRKLYGMSHDEPAREILSLEAWRALPPLSKSAVAEEPLVQRLFAPLSEVDHLRATSGTSGKPPLVCPRVDLTGLEYRLAYHDFKKPILSYTVPLMPHWHERLQESLGYSPRVVAFDPRRAAASIHLARIAGVDSISVFAFHMPLIIALMQREGMTAQIRFIEIAGEACSHALLDSMRATFPNAVIIPFYGSTEVEDCPIGVPCRPITGEEPLAVYHGKASQYLELINPVTGACIEPTEGAEGELLVSAYQKAPRTAPLIRYRIGDMVRVVSSHCQKHGEWSFTVLGRVEADFMKVPGGVLRADEVERVLRGLRGRVSDRFELHRFDRATPAGVRVEVLLKVEAPLETNFMRMAEEIAAVLRVSPIRTYAEGVADGLYVPLRCEPLLPSAEVKKRKRMIHHV